MNTSSSVRPREKIAERSVHALSEHELLQAIIGSGTSGFPVNRIARKVQDILKSSSEMPSYGALKSVDGVGIAMAARLSAVFELVRRRKSMHDAFQHPIVKENYYIEVTAQDAVDGTLSVRKFSRDEKVELITQRVCRYVLFAHASQLSIQFRYAERPNTSLLDDLRLVKKVNDGCELLGIRLVAVRRAWAKQEKVLL